MKLQYWDILHTAAVKRKIALPNSCFRFPSVQVRGLNHRQHSYFRRLTMRGPLAGAGRSINFDTTNELVEELDFVVELRIFACEGGEIFLQACIGRNQRLNLGFQIINVILLSLP